MTVLDAGCGGGRNLVYLLREGYRVFACDIRAAEVDIRAQEAQGRGTAIVTVGRKPEGYFRFRR